MCLGQGWLEGCPLVPFEFRRSVGQFSSLGACSDQVPICSISLKLHNDLMKQGFITIITILQMQKQVQRAGVSGLWLPESPILPLHHPAFPTGSLPTSHTR